MHFFGVLKVLGPNIKRPPVPAYSFGTSLVSSPCTCEINTLETRPLLK